MMDIETKSALKILTQGQTAIKEDIENLAQMVARGFEGVGQEIQLIKNDVGELKSDVSELKNDVADLKNEVLNINQQITIMRKQIAQLQIEMSETKDILRQQNYAREIDDLRQRVKALEEKVNTASH